MQKPRNAISDAILQHHERPVKLQLSSRLIEPDRPFETVEQISRALLETHTRTEDIVQWARHPDQDPDTLKALIKTCGAFSIPRNAANLWPHIHGSVMLGKFETTDHPTVKVDDKTFWHTFSTWAANEDLAEYFPDNEIIVVNGCGEQNQISVSGPVFRRFIQDLELGGEPSPVSIAIGLSVIRRQDSYKGNPLLNRFNGVEGARTTYADLVFEKINEGVIHFQGIPVDKGGNIVEGNEFRDASTEPLRQMTPQLLV